MDKIDVTQNARQAAFDAYLTCYESVPNDLWLQALLNGKHDGDEMAQAFARFERDILATRTDATPVAWMPKESAPKDGTPFLATVDGEEYPITLRWNAYDAAAQEEIGEDGYFHYADEALAEIDPDALQRFSEGFVWMPLPAAPDATNTHPPATDVAAQDDTALLERLADEACKRLGIDPNEIVDPVGPVRKKDDIIYAMYAFAREKFWDTEPNDVAALVEAAKALVDHCWETEKALTEKVYRMDYCGESVPLCNLRQALAPFTKGQP